MVGYKLGETRLVQQKSNSSAANADVLLVGDLGPPDGKLWVVTAFSYIPSVAETQIVSIEKLAQKTNTAFALLNPISLALFPAMATFIEQGMEYLFMPGECVRVRRGDHTAGSSMSGYLQFIEIDQPLYTYDEPQVIKRQERALSSVRTVLGGAVSSGQRIVAPSMTGERGGRSGPLRK